MKCLTSPILVHVYSHCVLYCIWPHRLIAQGEVCIKQSYNYININSLILWLWESLWSSDIPLNLLLQRKTMKMRLRVNHIICNQCSPSRHYLASFLIMLVIRKHVAGVRSFFKDLLYRKHVQHVQGQVTKVFP